MVDLPLQLLKVWLVLERINKVFSMLVIAERMAHVVDERVELLPNGLGRNRVTIHYGAHDEDWEPSEKTTKRKIVRSGVLPEIAERGLDGEGKRKEKPHGRHKH